jgi:hypothetical protein
MTNTSNNTRNPFVALCQKASQDGWCWAINCTSCGHQDFEVGFSKIINGEHPDTQSFFPEAEIAKNPGEISPDDQLKLVKIVAAAKLTDIQEVSEFPDWLNYIGLVIHHCPSVEARKILSDSLLPQFISLVKDDTNLAWYLQGKLNRGKSFAIKDLGKIQNSLRASLSE